MVEFFCIFSGSVTALSLNKIARSTNQKCLVAQLVKNGYTWLPGFQFDSLVWPLATTPSNGPAHSVRACAKARPFDANERQLGTPVWRRV